MPTTAELVDEIRDVLSGSGVNYGLAGARDTHYAIWIFAMIFDEATAVGSAVPGGLSAPGSPAVFRRNPSDLDDPPNYTHGIVRAPLHDWEVHVDVNVLGASGATHGVDVSLIPGPSIRRARKRSAPPSLYRDGLGIEAKCFTKSLNPNEGRVTLGFQQELGSVFWLAANGDNDAVRTMLRMPGRRTAFFGNLKPGTQAEAEFRVAVRAQLSR